MIKTSKEYRKCCTVITVDYIYTMLKKPKKLEYIHTLLKDNRKEIIKLFGPPHFYYKGEFYFHCWSYMFKGNNYLIMTAKTKGTCFEVNRKNSEEKIDGEFIEFIYENLKTLL